MVETTININFLNSQHADYNHTLAGLCSQAVISGATNKYNNDGTVTYFISNENFPMTLGQTLIGFSCEVYKMPFFIKIDSETSNVPQGLPNRTYTDENGAEQIKNWQEWKLPNFNFHVLSDGFTYIAAEANTGDHVYLADFMAESANLIDVATFRSLQPAE